MMIKSLHLAGMSIEQIAKITGETVETIQKILITYNKGDF